MGFVKMVPCVDGVSWLFGLACFVASLVAYLDAYLGTIINHTLTSHNDLHQTRPPRISSASNSPGSIQFAKQPPFPTQAA
jgi:hypothetical protein